MNIHRKKVISAVFWIIALALLVGTAGGIIYMFREGSGSLPVLGQSTNFTATVVTGKTMSFDSLNGKVLVVTWFYTHCPDECPLTAYKMEQIQNELEKKGEFGSQVAFVSITFDPQRDTLPVIQAWANHFHANLKGWYFLRANPAETKIILQQWGVQVKPGATPEYFDHITKTDLIDEYGNIRKTYTGANLDTNEVMNDIQGLLARRNWG